MRSFQLRRAVSLSLMLLAAVLTYTGIVLFIAPHGRVAYWTDWHFLGLDKDQLAAIHTTCSLLFVALGLIHTWYNWKPITTYLKNKARQLRVFTREMVAAAVLVLLFVAGSALGLPPFQQVIDLSEAIRSGWEEREGGPPYGHAELTPVGTLARRMGWDEAGCRAVLQENGLVVEGERSSIADIAQAYGRTPAEVFTLLESSERCTAGAGSGSGAPPPQAGLGRKTLEQYCEGVGLEPGAALERLAEEGIPADPGAKLKDIAADAGLSPHDLVELLEPPPAEPAEP